ncbi:putative srpk, partial [Sistotremastrum suecicum HHB10207 ss-3]
MEFKEPDEFWWEFSTERLSSYKPGGFHPVHIGDLFSKIQATGRPRYKILAKLGTGSYSTVWLATDMLINRLVALKIIVARLTGHNKEIPILDRLSRCEPGTAGVAHIIRLLDSFQVEGPNGVHEVLVTEVVIGWNELYEAEAAPPVRKVATELALGLKHIHSLQIVHGGESLSFLQ